MEIKIFALIVIDLYWVICVSCCDCGTELGYVQNVINVHSIL